VWDLTVKREQSERLTDRPLKRRAKGRERRSSRNKPFEYRPKLDNEYPLNTKQNRGTLGKKYFGNAYRE
jgi:hypothetical protein